MEIHGKEPRTRRGGLVRNAKLEKNSARANVYAPELRRCSGICREDLPLHKLRNGKCSSCRKLSGEDFGIDA